MYRYLKRFFDVILSFFAIIVCFPLLTVIAVCVKLSSSGKVLFCQKRIGKDKKNFIMYKFRTMRSDAPSETPTHLLSSPEKYITPVGRFLRRTSLDELPQLFNILNGSMSFVGPRPALWNQSDLIMERDKYNANSVRPGLTGLAQINGRDELSIPEKAEQDGNYCKKITLSGDIGILFATFIAVFTRKGFHEGTKSTGSGVND